LPLRTAMFAEWEWPAMLRSCPVPVAFFCSVYLIQI
jgi:hypothetical protein